MEELGKTIGRMRRTITKEANCVIDKTLSAEAQAFAFHERLTQIIRPRNQSDRTGFRRIMVWVARGILDKELKPDTYEQVLRYATEASGPDSRNPAAVFMKILKQELGYARK
jgi:hypothetical protein